MARALVGFLAFLALTAVFASAAAQDQTVSSAVESDAPQQGGGWFDFMFQVQVEDNDRLSTWTFWTDENGDLEVELELPQEEESTVESAAPADLAMAAPTQSDDDSTDCGMFLQTAFDVCEQQRCDFRPRCHHHHHDDDEDEDQSGEAEAEDEEDNVWPERDEDHHDDRRMRGGHHHHHHHGPRIARQCRDAVADARDKMDQCAEKMFQSSNDAGFTFSYDDALTALEETNDELCECGPLCRHPMIIFAASAFVGFLMWATIYAKMLRCMVLRHRERRGCCKSTFLAVLLLPLSFIVLSFVCMVVTAMMSFPLLGIAFLASFGVVLLARRARLRRMRRMRQQRLAEAQSVDLPTVRVSAPAQGRTVPTATLVAYPAGRGTTKSDVVVTAIVV